MRQKSSFGFSLNIFQLNLVSIMCFLSLFVFIFVKVDEDTSQTIFTRKHADCLRMITLHNARRAKILVFEEEGAS